MATLHWIAFGPERLDLIQQVSALLSENDAVLFTGAGLLHLFNKETALANCCEQTYYQTQTLLDLSSNSAATAVSHEEIATLTLSFDNVITWHAN